MADFKELLKQAEQLKEQMERTRSEVQAKIVQGESGAGAVKIRMNGNYDALAVQIDADLFCENKEILEQLVCAAINDAVRKIEQEGEQAMRDMAGLAGLAGGFPFRTGGP